MPMSEPTGSTEPIDPIESQEPHEPGEFRGLAALVTGGASGIGLATAPTRGLRRGCPCHLRRSGGDRRRRRHHAFTGKRLTSGRRTAGRRRERGCATYRR
ncbi:hypothetical protein GCM10010156_60980 [Planobispora rosea]|uniref:Uncharacterized protein n=1 Tax=Planobispora rosea TaxID=35762 RepID=A0A8J3S799_PLARO|nr:hypothetical protein GCM10010156_60980 [Planobispora rosea]GIH87400.1 hypothetical protein Pro02_58080 [Planobispora rosea]